MAPEDLAHFKTQFTALAEQIQATLAQTEASEASIAPDNAIGRLTRMEAIQAQAMSAAGRHRLKKRLAQVERALEQIEKGDYGTCVRCGEAIPRGRLEIMPEARLCVTCAARAR